MNTNTDQDRMAQAVIKLLTPKKSAFRYDLQLLARNAVISNTPRRHLFTLVTDALSTLAVEQALNDFWCVAELQDTEVQFMPWLPVNEREQETQSVKALIPAASPEEVVEFDRIWDSLDGSSITKGAPLADWNAKVRHAFAIEVTKHAVKQDHYWRDRAVHAEALLGVENIKSVTKLSGSELVELSLKNLETQLRANRPATSSEYLSDFFEALSTAYDRGDIPASVLETNYKKLFAKFTSELSEDGEFDQEALQKWINEGLLALIQLHKQNNL